jgi:hypothetical protein
MSTGRDRSGIKSKTSKLVAVEVNGERLVIDSKAMTIRERQQARAELALLPDSDSTDAMAASIWIAMRRTNPALTFAEVCDSLTVADLDDAEFLEDDTSPEA